MNNHLDKDLMWNGRLAICNAISKTLCEAEIVENRRVVADLAIKICMEAVAFNAGTTIDEVKWAIFRNTVRNVLDIMCLEPEPWQHVTNIPNLPEYSHNRLVAYLYRSIADEIVEFIERGGRTVIDLGAGDGYFAVCAMSYIRKLGGVDGAFDIVSADLDDGRNALCRRYLAEVDYLDGIRTVQCDMESDDVDGVLMPDGGQFVVLTHVLEHIPTETRMMDVFVKILSYRPEVVAVSVPYNDPPETSISPGHFIEFDSDRLVGVAVAAATRANCRYDIDDKRIEGGLLLMRLGA
jgi:hypothetical protein